MSTIAESPRHANELETTALRIMAPICAVRLWERHLTQQEQTRLGGVLDQSFRRFGTAGIWSRLKGVSFERAVVEVALILGLLSQANARWLMREIGEPITVEDAIEAGGLVIESPRVVYWRRDLIDIQWTPGTWEFFDLLVRNAKIGQPIDADSFGELTYGNVVSNRKNRLKNLGFPEDLMRQIRSTGRGTQKLFLPPAQIHIFESNCNMPIPWAS